MNRSDVIQDLQRRIETALTPLFVGGKFALLDFPDHGNVGDSAIWLGEAAYFKKRDAKVVLATRTELPSEEDLSASGTIFLHGGGNFGTIWPAHQKLRIDVMKRAKGVPIIQLPQSIHFASEQDVDETAKAISYHGDFTLMVRDHPSLEFAAKHFDCKIVLSPDMAFCMGALKRAAPDVNRYCLLRTDLEKAISYTSDSLPPNAVNEDWLIESSSAVRSAKLLGALRHPFSSGSARRYEIFNAAAKHRVDRGSGGLSRGKVVITDRLHGHILCCLLGIPHVVLDNSYRKIGNFVDAWTREITYMRSASNLAEAAVQADILEAQFKDHPLDSVAL